MTNPHIHADKPTALYRLYDVDDVLLYLGISWNPDERMKEHVNDKHWVGLLEHWHYGRFRVLKGPRKEDVKEFEEAREDRKLRRAYQIWTVTELREAIKDLPDDTLISARLSGR